MCQDFDNLSKDIIIIYLDVRSSIIDHYIFYGFIILYDLI